jgi:hypothetical protein
MESSINIQLVHGGFIFTSQDTESSNSSSTANMIGGYKTEVFTSQAKLMKAVRAAIEANSLVKKTGEKTDAQGEAE